MIGQQGLLKCVQSQISNGTFPRFSIFVGERGSEKNEFGKAISKLLGASYVALTDCKVDTVREMIANAYKVRSVVVYGINDADSMSLQAKNSLLKVTEEPPNNAYFVMTLEDAHNTLPTIRSRGQVYFLEPYLPDELVDFADCDKPDIIKTLCYTPGDVTLLKSYGVGEFYAFVEKVVDHIATANGANVFKIAQSIRFKDTDESGYDLKLFWRAFASVCFNRAKYSGVQITSRYLSKLGNKSVNRSMLFDAWILDIRSAWED